MRPQHGHWGGAGETDEGADTWGEMGGCGIWENMEYARLVRLVRLVRLERLVRYVRLVRHVRLV